MTKTIWGWTALEQLGKDIRYALRTLRKNAGFTATAVTVLALGIGSNTALFGVANAVLLQPLPYSEPERLVTLWETSSQTGEGRLLVSPANFLDWAAESRTIEGLAAFRPWGFVMTGGDEPRRLVGARVSASLFPLLGVKPIAGRVFSPKDDQFGQPHVAILSQALWEDRFSADPAAVGRLVELGGEPYTVVGVLPRGFALPDAEIWVPLAVEPFAMTQRGNRALTVVGRLKDHESIGAAQQEMGAMAAQLGRQYPDVNRGWGIAIVPLHESLVGRVRPTLLLVWAAVGLVLLIACANIGNLALARACAREHDMAVCTALGASRWRLIRQLMIESVVLGIAGGAAGLLLANAGTGLFVKFAPANFPRLRDISVNFTVLGFALVVSTLAGLVLGILPAMAGSQTGWRASLANGSQRSIAGRRHASLRHLSVASQTALAVIVLLGAGLLGRSLIRALAVDPGFRPEKVFTMSVSLPAVKYPDAPRQVAFYRDLLERVGALAGVQSAGLVSHLPMATRRLTAGVTVVGEADSGEMPPVDYVAASADVFAAMGTPLLRGRTFGNQDAMGMPPVVVINETMARRFWPHGDPLGARVIVGASIGADQTPRTVIGIVADIRSAGVELPSPPAVYVPSPQNPWPTMTVVMRTTGDVAGVVAALRREMHAIAPDQPVSDVKPLTEVVTSAFAPRRFQMILVAIYAAIALMLAATGVYAVVTYTVRLRTQEIGVRLALGATRMQILVLVVQDVMWWAAIGMLIGGGAAMAGAHYLASLLFEITPSDPPTVAGVLGVAAGVVVLAGALAGRRAVHVNPLAAIRE
jgi:putative ABC transport system permease protein